MKQINITYICKIIEKQSVYALQLVFISLEHTIMSDDILVNN